MTLETVERMRTADFVEYFEIDSAEASTRYSIAVVLPVAYLMTRQPVPVIYAPDANFLANRLMGVANSHMASNDESIAPVTPCIQVMIGYVAEELPYMVALRNRDLVVPGEAYPPRMDGYLSAHLGLESGAYPSDILEVFRSHLENPRNDRFQAFIEKELHPQIKERYGVLDENAGLFGFSYGGLFSLCAFSRDSELFTNFGASSPGILVEGSRVHELYAERVRNAPVAARKQHVHISISDYELMGPTGLYRDMGIETLKFINAMRDHPIEGVGLSTEIVLNQDHATGPTYAYESFLRICYSAR